MKKNCLAAWLFLACFPLHANVTQQNLTERADVKAFASEMVKKHHFDPATLNQWLNSATIQPTILTTIAKPAEQQLPWHRYQQIFISPKRINDGVAYWKENKKVLERAEQEYGVPPEMVVAILGVETFYGKQAGKYRVLDSLVTLGFDYPPRSKFFLSELEEFLVLSQEEGWDPATITGSYAGAMGKAQFISSSYRRFAIDFNQNGKRDLIGSDADAIGSIANYFKVHGWEKGGTIVLGAKVKGNEYKKLLASKANPKPEHTLQALTKLGVQPTSKTKAQLRNQSFALIKLEGESGAEYWLGGQNFYVITRYNHSDHYAMAVYTLSQRIKEAYQTA